MTRRGHKPYLEVDSETGALYVYIDNSRRHIKVTSKRVCESPLIVVDRDAKGTVVGVEIIVEQKKEKP